ncbi:HAD family hydrolase [Streptomyces cavernicola]|uniref:HAD family hydrolase n=1 Tax=Streptomyces cavernicola TaxID=3043613 RepID=A0ABT6SEM3_9ACTN|nr:HAD family hydrolase [Streptomyces sp. B-S-A6]MDI3406132.1 HAD family hydrolase [Streptomyces sp. B-S-A6]
MPIRAVLWDIDDTLFDYASADTLGMRAHLEAEGILPRYGTATAALARWQATTQRHWARFSAGEVDFLTQRRDRVRDFLDEPGLTDPDSDAWFHRYIGHYEAAWALFPDALPALDALADGYRHAVLSNSHAEAQERKLRLLGVRDRFEALLCAAQLGVAKPAPEAFHAACRTLALTPAEVAYVGDQPEIDARGAHDAGLLGIWLDRSGTEPPSAEVPPGVRRITGLAELPELLAGDTRFGAPSTFG